MVLQKLWVSQKFSRISRVSQSRFFSGYVRLAVSIFIRSSLGVSTFCKVKGFEVLIRLIVLINNVFSSLDTKTSNFNKATFKFPRKS